MDYSMQQHTDPSGWTYSQLDSSLRTNANEPLQEPVPFEDFQFSFGLEPGFAMPVPLDMPPAPPSLNDTNNLFPMDYQQGNSHDFMASTSNNPLLDENDQKAFSQFLDAFFVDKDGQMSNAEQMASQFSTMYDAPPSVLNDGYGTNAPPPPPPPSTSETGPYHTATSMFLPKQTQTLPVPRLTTQHNEDGDDEYRRSSILQSLDQQKQFHQRLNRVASVQQQQQQQQQQLQLGKESTPSNNTSHYQQDAIGPNAIFLQQSNQVSAPFISKHPTTTSQRYHPQQHAPYPPPERQHPPSASVSNNNNHNNNNNNNNINNTNGTKQYDREHQRASSRSSSTPTRRNKSNKELLTEEEKRNNHIASEQKRRSTIRNGFKDLTDIVPTLKNINNSKSTVLFKAVDYIKYLEKRNKSLRDKMGSLEVRIKVEGRVSDILMHSSSLQQQQQSSSSSSSSSSAVMAPSHSSPTSQPGSKSPPPPLLTTAIREDNDRTHYQQEQQQQIDRDGNNDSSSGGGVAAALLAHKSQQRQLMALQEQLQYHQRLLAQQQDDNNHHRLSPHPPSSSQRQTQQYHSMSSSSTSSSSHSSPQSSDLYQHPSVPPPRWTYDPNTRSNNSTNVKMEVDNEEPLKVSA